MQIGVLGINFKSADIHVRELVSKACQKRLSYFHTHPFSCVLLSTCNRTEVYFSAPNLADAHSEILHILREEIAVSFEHQLYTYFGFDCFLHLALVAAGLDSAIIAESEIQRQVKLAYEQTTLYEDLPSCMHYLFQKSLKMGKLIRTIVKSPGTLEKILLEMSQNFNDVLFIGNSEINRKIIAYFKRKSTKSLTLCTRSLPSAQEMAKKDNIALLPWNELLSWQQFPLVICGSNAPYYLLTPPQEKITTRLVIDLSVPRNVDPSLEDYLPLFNMQTLTPLLQMRQQKNSDEIHYAITLIFNNTKRYMTLFQQKEKRVFACA